MKHKRYMPVPLASDIPPESEEYINLKEASEISGFSIPYLRTISQLGRLKAQKQAKTWVTTLAAIEEYKNNRMIKIKKV